MILFLLPVVSAFDSKDEAETLGLWTMIISLFLLAGLPALMLSVKLKPQMIWGLTNVILLLQQVSMSVLMNFKYSEFYFAYWNEIFDILNPLEIYSIDEDPPRYLNLRRLGIDTSDFIANTDENQFLYIITIVISVIIWLKTRDERWSGVMWWTYTVSSLNLFLFACVQFEEFNADSLMRLGSSSLAVLLYAIYLGVIICPLILVRKGFTEYVAFFTDEFDEELESYYYYPMVIFMRGALMHFYVFCYDYKFLQFGASLTLEFAILAYLLISRPFKTKANLIISLLYHLGEGILLSMPYLYESTSFSTYFLDNFMFWLTVGLIFMELLKYIIDCKDASKTNSVNVIGIRTKEGNTRVFEMQNQSPLPKINIMSPPEQTDHKQSRLNDRAEGSVTVSGPRPSVRTNINHFTVIRRLE